MDINIKSTGIVLTDDISEYLNKRLGPLEKLLDSTDSSVLCNVEVGKTTKHHLQGEVFRAEINLHTAGHNFRAVSEKETLYEAIDDAKDEMQRELRRAKRKRIHMLHRGGAKIKEFLRGVTDRARGRLK